MASPSKANFEQTSLSTNPVGATLDLAIYAARPTPLNSISSQLVTRSNPVGATIRCLRLHMFLIQRLGGAPQYPVLAQLPRHARPRRGCFRRLALQDFYQRRPEWLATAPWRDVQPRSPAGRVLTRRPRRIATLVNVTKRLPAFRPRTFRLVRLTLAMSCDAERRQLHGLVRQQPLARVASIAPAASIPVGVPGVLPWA